MKNLSLLTLMITWLTLGCAAEPPVLTLSAIAAEAAGENCAAGGLEATTGKDTDGKGTLDAAEVIGADPLCKGETGATRCRQENKRLRSATAANQHNRRHGKRLPSWGALSFFALQPTHGPCSCPEASAKP